MTELPWSKSSFSSRVVHQTFSKNQSTITVSAFKDTLICVACLHYLDFQLPTCVLVFIFSYLRVANS